MLEGSAVQRRCAVTGEKSQFGLPVAADNSTVEAGAVPLIGHSPAMAAVKSVASIVARRRCTIMLLGETGTGKEVLARHIHAESSRAAKPFVSVDCSAICDSLFESELFGHVRGAFTGAVRDSLGFVRAADGGTLFLDEIGELSLPLQAKLLRLIQEQTVVPVGDVRAHRVDVRIIVATHRDLSAMVRDGAFRQDLYFRLNVVVLNLPPLRQRREDIIPLAEHFLAAQSALYGEPLRRLSAQAAEALLAYSWPGNVRELANVMEHAHVLSRDTIIQVSDLPPRFHRPAAAAETASELSLIDLERRAIAEALRRTNYCKAAASRLLGINVQRLNRRMAKLRIEPR